MLQNDSDPSPTKLQLKPVFSHVIQSGTNFIHNKYMYLPIKVASNKRRFPAVIKACEIK